MNQDILLAKLRAIFLEELEENARVIESILVSLEGGKLEGNGVEVIDELYRAFHSIKGASAMVKADKIKDLAHISENTLSAVRDGTKSLDESTIQSLFDCVDNFRELSKDLESSDREEAPLVEVSSAVNVAKNSTPNKDVSNARGIEKKSKRDEKTSDSLRDYSEDYVSISSKRLESMQNLVLNLDIHVRELSKLSAKYAQDFNQLKASQRTTLDKSAWRALQGSNSTIVSSIRSIEYMLAPLDEEILKASMQRFSDGFSWLPRMVRDQAIESGKKVQLEVIGGDVEISGALVRLLSSPLRHLIRNAIDHGIESSIDREKSGKPTTGTIRVEVSSPSRRLQVILRDDGRGLNLALIKETALSRGIACPKEENKLLDLIFQSGFTTSKTVSDTSGRGVGLDAVKTGLMRYGGTINALKDSEHGTAFCLSLPSHAYRIRALQFRSCAFNFALDCNDIESITRLSQDTDLNANGGMFVGSHSKPFPYILLSKLLKLSENEPKDSSNSQRYLILLKVGENKAGIVVDAVNEVLDVLIKELPRRLGRLPVLQGSVVTGIGGLAYVLNAEEVVHQVLDKESRPQGGVDKGTSIAAKKKLLVVDDTFTTSALIETILENAGFDIVSARDGEQAWTILTQQNIDLLVTDFEMPHLNGIELTGRIRKSSNLKNLPIILLTGRDSKEDRLRGLEAGADVYLVKSAFDQSDLLQSISELL